MKPIKSLFPLYTKFTLNVDEPTVNFHINNSYRFILRSRLGSIADDIYNLSEESTARPELKTFYTEYLLPYWILLSIKRFLTSHGIHITQQGIIVLTDPQNTFIPATPAERALLMQDVETDLAAAETLLLNELQRTNWTIDSVVYRRIGDYGCNTSDSSSSSGMWGISAID